MTFELLYDWALDFDLILKNLSVTEGINYNAENG